MNFITLKMDGAGGSNQGKRLLPKGHYFLVGALGHGNLVVTTAGPGINQVFLDTSDRSANLNNDHAVLAMLFSLEYNGAGIANGPAAYRLDFNHPLYGMEVSGEEVWLCTHDGDANSTPLYCQVTLVYQVGKTNR